MQWAWQIRYSGGLITGRPEVLFPARANLCSSAQLAHPFVPRCVPGISAGQRGPEIEPDQSPKVKIVELYFNCPTAIVYR
jgi:hypothetical protein